MKKAIAVLIMVLISLSPLFRGLFFDKEALAFTACLAFLAALYLVWKVVKKDSININPIIMGLTSLLAIAYAFGFIHAVNARENLEALTNTIVYLLAFIVLYDYSCSDKGFLMRTFVPLIVISDLSCGLIGLLPMPGFLGFLNSMIYGERIGSTFQYANTASMFYYMGLIFILIFISQTRHLLLKVFISGAGSILALAFLQAGSRGGFVCGFFGFLLFICFSGKGKRVRSVFLLFLVSVPAIAFYQFYSSSFQSHDYKKAALWCAAMFFSTISLATIGSLVGKISNTKAYRLAVYAISVALFLALVFFTIANLVRIEKYITANMFERFDLTNLYDMNTSARLNYYEDAFKIIKSNWITGVGGGGWNSLYQSVQSSYYTSRILHNHYLQVFLEAGIPGIASFLGLLAITIYNLIKAYKNDQGKKRREAVAGLISLALPLALHIGIDFDLSFVSMQLIFWFIISAATSVNSENSRFARKLDLNRLSVKSIGIIMVFVSIGLASLNAVQAYAASEGEKGLKFMADSQYEQATGKYERASRFDPINSDYSTQLALLYDYYLIKSDNPGDFASWSKKAIKAARDSVRQNHSYPTSLAILTNVYFNSGLPLDALSSTKKLIMAQPKNDNNYELLARGYMEAADFYKNIGNNEMANNYLTQCAQMNSCPNGAQIPAVLYYKSKASIALGNLADVHEMLIAARDSSDKYKLFAEILLYIVDQKTGMIDNKDFPDLSESEIKESALNNEMSKYLEINQE